MGAEVVGGDPASLFELTNLLKNRYSSEANLDLNLDLTLRP